MSRLLLVLVGLSLWLFSLSASALVPKADWYRASVDVATASYSTRQAATDAGCLKLGPVNGTWKCDPPVLSGTRWFSNYSRCDGTNCFANGQFEILTLASAACPVNSTASGSQCQCDANFDESGGQCVPHVNQCAAKTGMVGILSWTEGYTRTPDEGDRQAVGGVMSPPASGEVCDGGCSVSLQTSGPGVQPYVSQSPTANGLYRRSVDYPMLGLGKECTATAADAGAKKDTPPPACPGSVGDIGNGKPVCVGTAAKPVTATPLGAAPGAEPIAGNPPAGTKPPSGDGSGTGSTGRTPTGGNGDANGGPAGAAVGGKGGGAGGTAAGAGAGGTGTGENKDPCGGPGQPVCNVKVDEKGTPTGAGAAYDPAKAKMDETKQKNDEQLTKAAGTSDKGFFEPLRSMFWAPPVAACETFDLPQSVGGLKIDPCGVVDGVRNVMAFIWAAVGLFMCFRMIKGSF